MPTEDRRGVYAILGDDAQPRLERLERNARGEWMRIATQAEVLELQNAAGSRLVYGRNSATHGEVVRVLPMLVCDDTDIAMIEPFR